METISLDTETTGPDFFHGCKPFYVSTCTEDEEVRYWEWFVNPKTRRPQIPQEDKEEIKDYLREKIIVLHNAKFDIRALSTIGIDVISLVGGWKNIDDTLLASHCLSSGESHKLKDLAFLYLEIPRDDQENLKKLVQFVRRKNQKLEWDIAKSNHRTFPHIKLSESLSGWMLDIWLPRAYANTNQLPKNDPFWTVLQKYANNDAIRTMGLWMVQREALKEEGLYNKYFTRQQQLEITYEMESVGFNVIPENLKKSKRYFFQEFEKHTKICQDITGIENPRSFKQLQIALYDTLQIPTDNVQETKSGYSTSAETLDELWGMYDDPKSDQYRFLESLLLSRKAGTISTFTETYDKAIIKTIKRRGHKQPPGEETYILYTIHPWYNITGTKFTRWSCQNPNQQQVSKKENYNIRDTFGPPPGYYYLSIDLNNIELRIFAYDSGDQDLIKAFEQGYSVHLLIAELLYPQEFEECKRDGISFEEKYEATLYQWIKNGNFALIYGAAKKRADATYHFPGAYEMIRERFEEVDRYMDSISEEGIRKGYIYTVPTIQAKENFKYLLSHGPDYRDTQSLDKVWQDGYRIDIDPNAPHAIVNARVQGTAAWMIQQALINCKRARDLFLPEVKFVCQIHDEILFLVPIGQEVTASKIFKKEITRVGEPYGIPTPCKAKLIKDNWSLGITI